MKISLKMKAGKSFRSQARVRGKMKKLSVSDNLSN